MKTLRNSKPKARKSYCCDFCLENIEKGEIYSNQTNVFDNKIYTWRTHTRCNELASKLKMYDSADEGVTTEIFEEYVNDKYRDTIKEYGMSLESFVENTFKKRLDVVCEVLLEKKIEPIDMEENREVKKRKILEIVTAIVFTILFILSLVYLGRVMKEKKERLRDSIKIEETKGKKIELKLKISLYKNAYLSGGLNVMENNGKFDFDRMSRDSIEAIKMFK